MSSRACAQCGKTHDGKYQLCWRCYSDNRIRDARVEGYRDGYRAGSAEARETGRAEGIREGYERGLKDGREQGIALGRTLDSTKIRTLIQLCHPDKHGNSRASNQMTSWLLEQRRAIAADARHE